MIKYQKVLSSLGVDEKIKKIASGEISVPMFGSEAPAYWYGFPPALIPLWSNGSRPKYFGIWKHWFLDRQPTYVEMLIAADRLTIEIAQTAEQLFCFATISAIVEEDGITSEIEKFSNLVEINNLGEIDTFTSTNGDNAKYFSNLPQFSTQTPLKSISNTSDYKGDFPFISASRQIINLDKSSEFEAGEELTKEITKNKISAPWVMNEKPRQNWFDEFLLKKQFGEAWLALNCRGWSIEDARNAISKLADAAGNLEFNDLASAWLSVADPKIGGY